MFEGVPCDEMDFGPYFDVLGKSTILAGKMDLVYRAVCGLSSSIDNFSYYDEPFFLRP